MAPQTRPFDAFVHMNGYFGYQSGSGSVIDGVSLSLQASGAFSVTRTAEADAKRLPRQVFGTEFWTDCTRPPASGCTVSDSYVVGPYSLTIAAQGKTKNFFLRRETDQIQIGDEWFR